VTTFYELVKVDELVKSLLGRHPGGRRGPEQLEKTLRKLHSPFKPRPAMGRLCWIPAFAGMTEKIKIRAFTSPSNQSFSN
jgi:hypothetical protein